MNSVSIVKNMADILKCEVKTGEPMSLHTTFKIGGGAELFVKVKKPSQLAEIVKICNRESVPYMILGKGSNLLVSDKGISGVVIALDGDFKAISVLDNNTIYCGSASSLAKLCSKALSLNLTGLEFGWGIPGSAGGALYMNAGAYGGEMKDVVYSVTHMNKDGRVETLSADKLNLGYRTSVYRENGCIILGVTVKLSQGDPVEIRSKMDDYMDRRKAKQPLDYPSAGSVFKRPEGNYAGALIEKCGLKGLTVGGAKVSDKHAGFIINTGTATCEDVLSLISKVQEKVNAETGYFLEREIVYVE
ncbi:UDP-N-acetylmuramate dehydrogenase [bacterium]|nr:UDP-N-acetylmuramate dehydrogenase [bacterium]